VDATLAQDHPKQRLLFFLAQEFDDGIQGTIRGFVLRLALLRRWLNGAPRFVDLHEEPEDPSREDQPIDTVGGYIEIYSAYPPWTLPREIELQHLDEVTALVNALCDLSREHELAFELELDDKFVGSIVFGTMNVTLSVGLLGEWRRVLGV
jgi:hypothetical protein